MSRRSGPGHGEAGSAAVLGTVLVSVLATVTMLVAVVGAAVTDQRRLEAAADLGALAGASAAQRGEDACAAAGAMTARNGARLSACSVVGDVVTMRARPVTEAVLGLRFTLTATARAGPASAVAAVAPRAGEAPKGDIRGSQELARGPGVRG